jgi:hypothetical protein
VAIEKLLLKKFAKNKIASGCPTNDFLDFPRHFLSPKFRLFWRKWSFSTATGDSTQNPVNERNGDFSPTAKQPEIASAGIIALENPKHLKLRRRERSQQE